MLEHKANFPNDERKLLKKLSILRVPELAGYIVWIDFSEFSELEEIGRGGFGTVFKAKLNCHKRRKVVALKKIQNNNSLRNEVIIE